MENLEILTEKRKNLFDKSNEVTKHYKDIISKLVERFIGEKWACVNLYNESLQLGFVKGTWENGNPRYQTFDIYFKPNHREYDFTTHTYSDPYFKFEINTCCFGSFSVKGESTPKTYYIGVGKLLSNTDLHTHLIETLKKFSKEYDGVRDEIDTIDKSIKEIENAEAEIKIKKEETELFEQQKEILVKIKDGETKYIVITKGETCGCNYTYRKQPVRWATTEVFDEQYQAMCTARMCNRSNYIGGRKYAVIEISKLTIA